MTESELTPQEREVRSLLAQARHDEPVPDDVAARLDRVLAELRAESSPRPALDLAAARRRRQRLRTTLVAAVAVVVVGVGATQIDLSGLSGSESDLAGSAESAADGSTDDFSDDGAREEAASGEADAPQDAGGGADDSNAAPRATVTLTADGLEREVRRLVRERQDDLASAYAEDEAAPLVSGSSAALACEPPSGPGARVAAEYDGSPAVLVVRRPVGGVQMVDVYLCGRTAPIRSVPIPVG